MNQPMSFTWNTEAAEMAKKAGASGGISETGAYEGVITSAIYTFGRDGSKSQALELSFDSNGSKANYLRINFIGKDGGQTFGMGLVSALLWVAQVKQAQPLQVTTPEGFEWHCPALEGKKVGLFLQKVLYTKQDSSDGYKFEVRHVFQPGTRRTYAEYAENAPAEVIANLETSVKDKDERAHDNRQSPPPHGGSRSNPYTQDPQNSIPNSRLQQAAAQNQVVDFDDDIPF
ncbi:hypothetical protein LF927_09245 [Pectobacterium polaris]|uniref:hypothetical protein n=2 Tax=Pectobacterium polaris TaxID=2042057 RepID=UPI001CF45387|nr:hypothetical protein [Pectobacterium polaris]MCA6941369.1 hypothetical protein [Pectobacterium polaris]MCA6956423.1 hypothetical protein [Pectobacterium polaris]